VRPGPTGLPIRPIFESLECTCLHHHQCLLAISGNGLQFPARRCEHFAETMPSVHHGPDGGATPIQVRQGLTANIVPQPSLPQSGDPPPSVVVP
jgi:hypothetical protein